MSRQTLFKLALLGSGLVVGVLLGEVALRILKPPLAIFMTRFHGMVIDDEDLGHLYRPNATARHMRNMEIDNIVHINSLGFHDVERVARPDPEASRILAVGDSFTAAVSVGIPQGWTQTLERELRSKGHGDVEVVNLGVSGSGTDAHSKMIWRFAQLFEPEIGILAFHWTDVPDMRLHRRYRKNYGRYFLIFEDEDQRRAIEAYIDENGPSAISWWLFTHSYVFRVLSTRLGADPLLRSNVVSPSRIGLSPLDRGPRLVNVDDVFLQLIQRARRSGFHLVVAPVPGSRSSLRQSLDTLSVALSGRVYAQLDVVNVLP